MRFDSVSEGRAKGEGFEAEAKRKRRNMMPARPPDTLHPNECRERKKTMRKRKEIKTNTRGTHSLSENSKEREVLR